MTPYQHHRKEWQGCKRCGLCDQRTNVVFCRGTIPADILFIGEAPGASEDILGKPFVGPAGKLLDSIIADALGVEYAERPIDHLYGKNGGIGDASIELPRIAFTNLVACIPRGEDGDKIHEPPREAIEACFPRLREFVRIVKPRLIVSVGALAGKWVPKLFGYDDAEKFVEIVHPAAILRSNVAMRGLAIQRATVLLADAVSNL